MHERDLRRLALESGKTMSKRAKAKQMSARSSAVNSPMSSPIVSPNGSKAGSRAVSQYDGSSSDDDLDSDDGITSSIASLDLLGGRANEFADLAPAAWEQKLNSCVGNIIERSRTTKTAGEAREELLAVYASILQAQYAADEIFSQLTDLIPAILKSCKTGAEKEAILALQALSVTVVTTGEALFHEAEQTLKSRASDLGSELAQAAAVQTLGIVAFFGGADYSNIEDLLEYFLEIVQSDGESIGAHDSIPVVAAALQQWGLLATLIGDMEGSSEDPLEAFEDQLDSSSSKVQIAAGDNIALLFEKSYSPREDDEEPDVDPTEDFDQFEYGAFKRKKWIERYSLNHNAFNLKSKLSDLSRTSAKHIAKDKRKDLHKAFSDVLHTVEHPWRGPRFSTALDEDAQYYMGHRLMIRQGKDSTATIDRWWKYHRYEVLKRVLGSGLPVHMRLNSLVRDALPSVLETPNEL